MTIFLRKFLIFYLDLGFSDVADQIGIWRLWLTSNLECFPLGIWRLHLTPALLWFVKRESKAFRGNFDSTLLHFTFGNWIFHHVLFIYSPFSGSGNETSDKMGWVNILHTETEHAEAFPQFVTATSVDLSVGGCKSNKQSYF